MPFSVGENIGPYRIVEQLGQGGMATVFKAYHASLDRYVAIKVLHPAFNQDQNFEARFQREARVVAKLEHANIVPIYDYAEHEKRPYLIMKFIEGITLKARMDMGPLKTDEISMIVDKVGSALSYAHKQGVLHRDIKPSNVLLAENGQVFLADFGLARMAQSGESTLSSDMVMGTPQYISPEQAMGRDDLDQRTDLYSFGVMLYEMIVGKVPFNADTPFSIIHDHIYSPLPMPRVVNPMVSEPVERVLLKALAKNREDRFELAEHLVTAFDGAWSQAGNQKQDTKLSDASVISSEAGTVARPILKPDAKFTGPTHIASTRNTIIKTEESPDVLGAAMTGSNEKRFSWMWISVGLIAILVLGFLAFTRNNHSFAKLGLQKSPVSSPISNRQEPQNPPPVDEPLAQEMPPFVAEAESQVGEHPDDIDAQLSLALAYWEAGMQRQSFETTAHLINLAGPDNREFYMRAGNEFAMRDAWLSSASMFFQALKSFHESGEMPDEVVVRFHEAIYKGADRPEAPLIAQFEGVSRFDGPIALIARARNAFYTDRKDQAYQLLAEVKRTAPAMDEARLLEAEFSSEDGDQAISRLLAESLVSDISGAPDWIRIFAEEIIKRLP